MGNILVHNNMKYTVLMTVHKNDKPEHLQKSLMSMVNQTAAASEIIVVEDGPITGELSSVIDSVQKKCPNLLVRIRLKKNVGLGLALNEGLKIAKNDIVARMDADDISLSTRCELQLNEFKNSNEIDIVGCYVDEFVEDETSVIRKRTVPLTHEEIYEFAKLRDPFNHPTVMYRKSKVLMCGGYKDLKKNQDTDLWIRMLMNGCRTMNINKSLLLFRFDCETYRRRKAWENIRSLLGIRYKAYKIGFCSLGDFLKLCFVQVLIYIMPVNFQKWVYQKYLRTS